MNSFPKAPPTGSGIEGRYANYFAIGHNAYEFIIDFGQFYMENGEARMHTRIVTGPFYAKVLMDALRKSISAYQESFGPISERDEGPVTEEDCGKGSLHPEFSSNEK